MKGFKRVAAVLIAVLVLICFVSAVNRLEQGQQEEGIRQLELAVRRTAAACYAVEGFYPPSVSYMQQHYGLQYNEELYVIRYDIFASNLMPDITVLEKLP